MKNEMVLVAVGRDLYSDKIRTEIISTNVSQSHTETQEEIDFADSIFARAKYDFKIIAQEEV